MSWLQAKWRVGGVALLLAFMVVVGFIALHAREAEHLADIVKSRKYHGDQVPVRTALVADETINEVIGGTALTIASEAEPVRIGQVQSGFEFELRLKAVHVHEGDVVEPGKLLFTLDDREIKDLIKERQAALTSAKAGLATVMEEIKYNQKIRELKLASAESELKYRTEDLDNKTKELAAIRQLFKEEGATQFQLYTITSEWLAAGYALTKAERDREIAHDALPVGKLKDDQMVAAATAAVDTATSNLAIADFEHGRYEIRSKTRGVAGYTNQVELLPGEVVSASSTLVNIYKVNPVRVRMDFPQERLADLAIGQEAEVILDTADKHPIRGTVVRLGAQVDSNLRVLPVLIDVPNPPAWVRPGLSGYVRLKKSLHGTTVASVAVNREGGRATTFVVKDGRAHLREIKVGNLARTGYLEVLDGLRPGEEVVLYQGNFYGHTSDLVKSNSFLMDGDPVNTDWKAWARH
jgi:multidrug efflux pump subunit AcrA (membrane-fusion protein)